eukprot:TRINITY_DN5251_c0_g2_i1.p1 TRINITY_DN5251_c0_g2~~TRINITY_DN5251_c0_g2_i1.p1  ORF type:complete len:802 (-),score=170.07 TRINITY_DN5251_c0_g2_i1:102-2480(-)
MPKLLVLSACNSDLFAQELLSTLSRVLDQSAIDCSSSPSSLTYSPHLAIIAITGDIDEEIAKEFARRFYLSLNSTNGSVEQSFNIAKMEVEISHDSSSGQTEGGATTTQNALLFGKTQFVLLGNSQLEFDVHQGDCTEAILPALSYVNRNYLLKPRMLPIANTRYVGRAKEMVELIRLLQDANVFLVSIWGFGGIGKTELAKALAWWYRDRMRTQTILWASSDSASYYFSFSDCASLLHVLLQGISVHTDSVSMVHQHRALRQYLERHDTIIFIDGWDKVEKKEQIAISKFINTLPRFSTKVVFTSREMILLDNMYHYRLDSLNEKDSRKLFWNAIKEIGFFKAKSSLSFNEIDILRDIGVHLGGHPLAILTAAGYVTTHTLSEIKNGISKLPMEFLQSRNEVTGEAFGVKTCMQRSIGSLNAYLRSIFERMSIFPDAIDLEEFFFLFPEYKDDSKFFSSVDELVRKSFITKKINGRGSTQFVMNSVGREYGLSMLGLRAQDIHQTLVQYYERKSTWLHHQKTQYHYSELFFRFNNRPSAKTLLDNFETFIIDEITARLWPIVLEKLKMGITIARELQYARALPKLHRFLAEVIIMHDRSRIPEALGYISQGVQMASVLNDSRELTSCKTVMGLIQVALGNLDEAKRAIEPSYFMLRNLPGVLVNEEFAFLLAVLGSERKLEGKYGEACQFFENGYRLLQGTIKTISDKLLLNSNDNSNQTLNTASGFDTTALYRLRLCKWRMLQVLMDSARLAEEQKLSEESSHLFSECLRVAEDIGDHEIVSLMTQRLLL